MASVIEGFLVSLGFQIDKDAYARFNASVEDAGKRMRGFATKTAAATAALAAAWTKTSSEISRSYQLSAATGASIRGISQLRLAIEAVGGNAGALDATLSTMSTRLASMPGYADQIKSVFGVSMTDSTGKARDMADVLIDISKRMQEMDSATAYAAAQATGLDGIVAQLIDRRFPEELQRAKDATGGLGESLDETAKSSTDLMNAFTNALSSMKLGVMSFVGSLNKEYDISGWVREQTKKIPDAAEYATKWTKARIRAEARYAEEIKRNPLTFFDVSRFNDILEEEKGREGMKDDGKRLAKDGRQAAAPAPDVPPVLQGTRPNTLGFRNRNPGNLRGTDGKFRTFATFEEGFRAMATQLKAYQNAGARNLRDIISTYAPANENDTESYIKAVAEYLTREYGTQIDETTALDLSSPQMLSSLTRAMIRQENGSGTDAYFRGASFEREAQAAAQAQWKSRAFDVSRATPSTPAPVTINQQIYVTGQGAAEKIASATQDSVRKASDIRYSARGAS